MDENHIRFRGRQSESELDKKAVLSSQDSLTECESSDHQFFSLKKWKCLQYAHAHYLSQYDTCNVKKGSSQYKDLSFDSLNAFDRKVRNKYLLSNALEHSKRLMWIKEKTNWADTVVPTVHRDREMEKKGRKAGGENMEALIRKLPLKKWDRLMIEDQDS